MAQLLWSSFGVEAHRRTLETPPDCSRRRNRLCENSSPAGDPGKTTSTVSIWRVFFGGEGSENPFFVLPKCHFGVFAQPGKEADPWEPAQSPPPYVGGYFSTALNPSQAAGCFQGLR